MASWSPKDPDEVLDYKIDWTDRMASNDTIATSTWTITETDGVLVKGTNSFTDTTTTVWLSAGTDGQTYELNNRITTSLLRTMDQTVRIRIKSR